MRRKLAVLGLGLLGVAALVIGYLASPRGAAPDERFLGHYAPASGGECDGAAPGSGAPGMDPRDGFTCTLLAENGLEVEIRVRVPPGSGPFPAIILQGGFRTGRDVIRHVPLEQPPIVWASLNYRITKPDGESIPDYLGAVGRLTTEAEETVAAALVLLDWLEQQPYVDADRTLVAGGSLGAFFAVIEGAIEPRFEGVAMLYGAGHLPAIVAVNVPYLPAFKRVGVEWMTNPHLGPVDPLHFVGRIAPRPFLMVNGTRDERIPRRYVEDLFDAASEPKELIWLDHAHAVQGDEALVGELSAVIVDWMRRQGWVEGN